MIINRDSSGGGFAGKRKVRNSLVFNMILSIFASVMCGFIHKTIHDDGFFQSNVSEYEIPTFVQENVL